MTDKQTYAFMSAAAYDERRGSENDTHTKAIEAFLKTNDGGNWTKTVGDLAATAAGASHSNPASGMQADVWTKGGEYVIAFRGTESSRSGSNDGFRSGDGLLDTSPSDDGTDRPQRVAKSTAIR